MRSESKFEKELFIEKVKAGSRLYIFSVRESKDGSIYLLIREQRRLNEQRDHFKIMIFQEYSESFSEGLQKALQFIKNRKRSYKTFEDWDSINDDDDVETL